MESYKIKLVSLNEKREKHFEKPSNEFDRLDWNSEISDCHNISREIVDLAINYKDNKSMFDDCHLFFSKFKSWYYDYFMYNQKNGYIKEQGLSNNSLWKGTIEIDDNCNITGFDSRLYSLKMIYAEFSILEDAFQTKDTKELLQNIDINYALHYYVLQLVKYSLAPPIKRNDFYKKSNNAYIKLIELLCNLHSAELDAKYKDLIEPSLFPVLNKYCYSEGMGDYVFDLNVLKYIGISTFCDIDKLKKEIEYHRKKDEIEEAVKNENKKEDENESPDKSLMETVSNNELPKNSQIAERAEIDDFLEGLKGEIWEGDSDADSDSIWNIIADAIKENCKKTKKLPINTRLIHYFLTNLYDLDIINSLKYDKYIGTCGSNGQNGLPYRIFLYFNLLNRNYSNFSSLNDEKRFPNYSDILNMGIDDLRKREEEKEYKNLDQYLTGGKYVKPTKRTKEIDSITSRLGAYIRDENKSKNRK
ncbi:hypothetical protein SAMN05444405_1125 [Bacteroides luti]|uniref:Uncharacterized protein n=1 Tax=Bacteroides luti TaxID=1297750 RepID=A0A1M5DLV8_9BACE|nr:hypothetical protein [Bacteroides luti]SHF67881.1 hypothetical protein SAMN05444405_1125 [Bacteroides luti]